MKSRIYTKFILKIEQSVLNRLVKISLKNSNFKVPKWIFEIRVKFQNFGLKLKFFPKKKRNSNKKSRKT